MDFARDFYWHDSSLLNISIDREDPNCNSVVSIIVDWIDDGRQILVFEDVWWTRIDFNFILNGKETLEEGFIAPEDDPDLLSFYNKMGKWGSHPKDLNCYVIKPMLSGSEIKIIAGGFRVEK